MSAVEMEIEEPEVPTTYSEIIKDAEGNEFTYECTTDLETGELIEVAYDPEGEEIEMSDLPGKPTGGPAVKKTGGLFSLFGMCGGSKKSKKVEEEPEEALEEEEEEA